jgi:putative transcriptional regulator
LFGLGKPRSRLGKWIDRHMTQEDFIGITGLSRTQVSRLCDGRSDIRPHASTQINIVGALRRKGYNVVREDFWSE